VVLIFLSRLVLIGGFFGATRGELSNILGMASGIAGFAIPVILPSWLYIAGKIKKNKDMVSVAIRVVQAGVVAMVIIAAYKAITGRVEPEFLASVVGADNSHAFNFGFLRYGIFWGWPSSHAGVAFAMSTVLTLWYRRKLWVGVLALSYASFIALGAALSFHWLSDVLSGIIVGSLIGYVVYKGGLSKLRGKLRK